MYYIKGVLLMDSLIIDLFIFLSGMFNNMLFLLYVVIANIII